MMDISVERVVGIIEQRVDIRVDGGGDFTWDYDEEELFLPV